MAIDVVGRDQIGAVETRGVDSIPPSEQKARPHELWWVFIAGQLSFGIMVLGTLPVLFGLSWWGAFTSELVGLLGGSLLYAPFAILGSRAGTNSAVSSGAHLGVVGRLGGSLQNLLIGIGFYSLVVWTGGQALIGGLNKLFGVPDGTPELLIAFLVVSALSVLVAILGHANVVVVQKVLLPIVAVLLIIGYVYFAATGKFNASYAGGHYALGSFWSTWVLSAVILAALPISYAPFVNDYARYISARRHSGRAVTIAAGGSMFVGCLFACAFATYTATLIPSNASSWVSGLIAVSPSWYVALICLFVGLVGGCGAGAIAIYGSGLDTSSIVTSLRRYQTTLIIGAIGTAVVIAGQLDASLQSFMTSFLVLLEIVVTPWMLIVLIGHWRSGGHYSRDDLQVFNRRERGGMYWYWHGVNPLGYTAWGAALIVGLLFATTSLYTGPFANGFGAGSGAYMAFVVAAVIGVVLYSAGLLTWRGSGAVRLSSTELPMVMSLTGELQEPSAV